MTPVKSLLVDRSCILILILLLSLNVFPRTAKCQEMSSCCSKATGSCRTVCEKMSLVEIAADTALREERLLNIKRFCSPDLIEFWSCMNETLNGVVRGSSWWGRVCCGLPRARSCQRACAVASGADTLVPPACRRSDEQAFFECVDKQEHGQDCCSNTHSFSCHEACRDIFRTKLTPSKELRIRVTDKCEEHSPKVMQCIRNYTKVTPVINPLKYLNCCDQSNNGSCRDTCKKVLRTKNINQEILDGLTEGGCGPPLPHDPLWQCFLRADSQSSKDNEISNINKLGMDSAKLHCCHKSSSNHCRRLCLNTFTNDWIGRWERFDNECLKQPQESALVHCIDEVEEPCELGCDGLSYCTNFNNRPTELFRACNPYADVAAHHDVALWQTQGFVDLPGLRLPVKNISKCSPQAWKTVACTLQIKPCSRHEHTNRICRDDCFSVLSRCVDWTRVDGDHNAASLCSRLSPDDPDTPCISLQNFMEPSDNPYSEPYEQVSSPCKTDPCNTTQICTINRNCPHGKSCGAYNCIKGCPLGEASQLLVPEETYVRIPISNSQKGCLKICHCTEKGIIDNCQPLPCFSYDGCTLANKNIQHGSTFYMECNICSCFAGEIICSKKQCDIEDEKGDGRRVSYTRLPCNCPTHHVPVCGTNGQTYPNSCLAKCAGLGDADIEFGACTTKNVCKDLACPNNSVCVPNPTICLSLMHRPCLQYICVNSTWCSQHPNTPVCDTEGNTHPTPCHMVNSGKKLHYTGKCLSKCSQIGTVCGINGNTYSSECAAWADYVSVDYVGPCVAVGLVTDYMTNKCTFENVVCPPLARPNCLGFTPPGACCPICGGALKLLYSRKQIDRALYALSGHSLKALTLKSLLNALERQIQVAECVVRGYVTVELDIFISVQSIERHASELQLEACVREAEKLGSLIRRQSARIVSELSLSALTTAVEVHTLPSSSARLYYISDILAMLLLSMFSIFLRNTFH